MLFRTRPNRPELDATKVPSALDIAWAAGVFEGEGHVRLSGKTKRGFMASVVQKEPEILHRLRDWFGGSIRLAHANTRPEHMQVYQWDICGDRARIFVGLIYSYLSSRRKLQVQATKGLDFMRGISPEGMTLEILKSHLLAYYQEHFETTDRNVANRRAKARLRYASDPEYRAKCIADSQKQRDARRTQKIVSIA